MSSVVSSNLSPLRCPRCEQVIEVQPKGASFCPFCGSSLAGRAGPGRIRGALMAVRTALLRPILARIREDLERAVPLTGGGDEPRGPSLVVMGYSAALYRLGWRYERGVGVNRNLDEAYRCYGKSARLGYVDATQRIATLPGPPTASSLESVEARGTSSS